MMEDNEMKNRTEDVASLKDFLRINDSMTDIESAGSP